MGNARSSRCLMESSELNEASLIGTKVADPEQPLEIIRTIHSFDPCIACAVHVVDTKGKELSVYKVNTSCSI